MEITSNQWPCQPKKLRFEFSFIASILPGQYLLGVLYLIHGKKWCFYSHIIWKEFLRATTEWRKALSCAHSYCSTLYLINLLCLEAENNIRVIVRNWIKFTLYVPVNCPILDLTYAIKFHAKVITSLLRWSKEIWSCSTGAQTAKGLADFCPLSS